MRRNVYALCIIYCILSFFAGRELSIKEKKRSKLRSKKDYHEKINNVTKKSATEVTALQGYHVTKKSTIEEHLSHCDDHLWKKSGVLSLNNYDDVEKHKRGFLANLASLLNDAELMAARKSENGVSALNQKFPTPNLIQAQEKNEVKSPTLPTVRTNTTPIINHDIVVKTSDRNSADIKKELINHTVPNLMLKNDNPEKDLHTPVTKIVDSPIISINPKQDIARKEKIRLPTPEELLNFIGDTGGDFAPIFAMYHGKVIPLGRLPQTAFTRKFITPGSTGENYVLPSSHKIHPAATPSASTKSSKDVTGNKRSLYRLEYNKENENDHISKLQERKDMTKLAQYLRSLDDHTSSSYPAKEEMPSIIKHPRDIAKDVVVFPDAEEQPPAKADLFNHVKGVVLDNGKFLSVKHNSPRMGTTKETIDVPPEEPPKNYFVGEEEPSLPPVIKRKPEAVDASMREPEQPEQIPPPSTTSAADPSKTVTLPLEVLKELLKKSDSKITLDSLLSKKPQRKSEPIVEPEENNPDMASKVTDNGVSLAALLNKKPEVKNDVTKESEEEDPGTIEDFAAGGLRAHNDYRTKHHDEPLVWSDDIAAKAQKLAETLADKKTLEIAKDLEKEGYGENVAKVWATFKNAGEAATKMWYSQSDNYHFDDPHLDENTGQFAQVVWKSTKELGMGVAKSIDDVNNKYVYVTALYRPPGNVETILRENVLPTGNNTVDVYTTFFKRAGVLLNNSPGKQRRIIASPDVSNILLKDRQLDIRKTLVTPDEPEGNGSIPSL